MPLPSPLESPTDSVNSLPSPLEATMQFMKNDAVQPEATAAGVTAAVAAASGTPAGMAAGAASMDIASEGPPVPGPLEPQLGSGAAKVPIQAAGNDGPPPPFEPMEMRPRNV